ncbi:hypothetical protein [Thermodesulfobacterium sp. TA1]|uniref:hypothetical protein n=1 Tax=Thermodesulfobacterium sp. TA1 TaxID=2234087 RepID=UPI00143D743B|nr:hypothetical protein [Thermodesulfobacterium sp. TA1]
MKRLILLGLFSLLGTGVSQAQELKDTTFGTLNLEGAVTVYSIYTNNKEKDKPT